jgi:hypothetical protein
VSLGRSAASRVTVNDSPVTSEAMVSMVLRLSEEPLFSRMVTGPSAPDQVSSKGLPGSGLMATLVNWTALAAAARAARITAV